MFIRRLMVIVFAFSLLSFLIIVYGQYLFMSDPFPEDPAEEEAWSERLDTYYRLQLYHMCGDPILYFALVYLFCTPRDLSKEYKRIILTIFVATLAGALVVCALGYPLARSLGMQALELWEHVRFVASMVLSRMFTYHFSRLFVGFTALTLSYIRRREQPQAVGRGEEVEFDERANVPP